MGERRVTADGRILEKMPDGTIVEVGRQQAPSQAGPQGAIPIGPRNTYRASEEQRQQAADARAEAAAARAASADARAAEAADRQAREWAATHNPDGSPRQIRKMLPMPEAAAKRLENDIGVYGTLDRLGNSFQPDYAGNSITGGFENWAQRRYSGFGTPGQAQWWQDLQTMDNTVRNQLFGASLTAGEQQAWEGTTVLPSMDAPEVKKNLARRREILQGALARRNKFLKANGYDPEAVDALYGEYGPGIMAPQQQGQKPRNVMDEITIRAPDITAAPPGSDKRALPYPPGFQEEYAAYMAQNMNGNMDPAAYAAFRNAHAQKYGYGPQPAGYYEAEAQQLNDYYNQGGRTIGGISPIEEDMTTSQMINNALANNPLSVAAMNAGDAGSGGLISAVAGDKVNMLNQANPNAALVGQIGGAILGAEGTGAIGRATLGKLAPMLMRGGRGAALGRGLAADATYSGVYGANTGQDPFESALLGGAGSLIGRGVGKATGAAIDGVSRLPAPAMLNRAGVPTTVGQNLGGIAKRVEDRAMSMPVIGDMIAKRRMESFNAFNRAAQNEAGAPIGAQFDQAGNWTEALPDQFGQAYDNATAGAQVPLDAQFAQDMARVRAQGSALPPDLAARFDRAMANRIDPISQGSVRPRVTLAPDGKKLRILDENGDQAGFFLMQPDPKTGDVLPFVGISGVDPGLRGKGYGAAAYDELAKIYPGLVPSPLGLSDGATNIWKSRISRMAPDEARNAIGRSESLGAQLGENPADVAQRLAPLRSAVGSPPRQIAQLTGDTYQQAMRGLKGYKAELTKPGFEADYRDALGGVQDALRGQMVRGGGDSVVSGLAKADEAYRMGKVVQDAQRRAINGSGSGKGGIFTPAQLNTAAMGNLKKFGGNRPFAALGDAGEEVLPSKIPDSGTAGRLWQLLIPTALGGAGYAANGTEGLWTAGGLMTLLALGATKRGQKGLNKLLFDRPDAAKALGAAVRKKQGLFGAASIPLLLESQ